MWLMVGLLLATSGCSLKVRIEKIELPPEQLQPTDEATQETHAMTSDKSQILIVRTFNTPVERVFQAWTDPQVWGKWMWNPYDRNLEVEVDLRIGGRFRIYTDAPPDMGKPGERWGMVGFYTEIVTNKRLAYTLHWDAPVGYNEGGSWVLDEVVQVDFTRQGEKTEVRYLHLGVPDEKSAGMQEKAIQHTFDTLDQMLTDRL